MGAESPKAALQTLFWALNSTNATWETENLSSFGSIARRHERSSAPRTFSTRRDIRLSRIYSVEGRAGVSPAPLGRQSERANSKMPAITF